TGTVNVTVTAPGGTSAISHADQFTYTAALAPTVTGISPTSGPALDSSVMITGTNFTGATVVDFGTTPSTEVDVFNDTTITALVPSGTVNVTVTGPGGTSATTSADLFTYETTPAVASLSPTTGSVSGGTAVTITGTGFSSAFAVDFGTTPAMAFTIVNDTTIS